MGFDLIQKPVDGSLRSSSLHNDFLKAVFRALIDALVDDEHRDVDRGR